ncbi:MAG TPA: hypothetical protein VFR05_06550 [Terriglobia bacterium]|nr:hypothetical protein [Terriglobia bacterium]
MNRYDLSLLSSRTHSAQPSALSVYLNVDQSKPENFNRKFEARLKRLGSTVQRFLTDSAERERYSAALQHVKEFVSVYPPAARTLALFFDASDGFFSHHELEFPVGEQIHWDRELLLQPLANAIDQLEDYGVVLTDRAKLRLFLVSLGGIQEFAHEDLNTKQVRHSKTVGMDSVGSSSRIQRKADNRTRANLRHVIKKMDELSKARKVHRFVLAGTQEITAELRSMLPIRLALSVVGEVVLGINASPKDVLASTRLIAGKYELDSEVEKVNSVVTSAEKTGKSVIGLGRTLKALNSDRVWELIYAGEYLSPGYECPKCFALFSARPTRCPYCSSRIQAVNNVVERAVEHALRRRARVEVVTGKASAALMTAGGIAAFLKTRPGSLEA